MNKIKTISAMAVVGLAVCGSTATYAERFASGNVNLDIEVDSAVALTIQSNSDGSTIYGASDPENQVVMNYTGEGITSFGVSSASTKLLPNSVSEEMGSRITVYTNSTNGYSLTVSDADQDNALVAGNGFSIPAGTNITAGISNWALKGGEILDYTAIALADSALSIKNSNTQSMKGGDVFDITYGVSTSGDQATGTYSDTIVYTLTADFAGNATFSNIRYLQEMTPEICAAETTPTVLATVSTLDHTSDTSLVPESTLYDRRDGKAYTVRKLADGHCWITQDLELDLNSNITFTKDDTDLNTKDTWTPINSTLDGVSIWPELAWKTDYGRNDGIDSNFNVPQSMTTPDTVVGNIYNWPAAVAENSTYKYNVANYGTKHLIAEDSICPKGWTLPTNAVWTETINNIYQIPFSSAGYAMLDSAPFSMQRIAYWTPDTYDWANAGIAQYGYNINMNAQGYRLGGHTVRCIAR